jgi:hypothetical protein
MRRANWFGILALLAIWISTSGTQARAAQSRTPAERNRVPRQIKLDHEQVAHLELDHEQVAHLTFHIHKLGRWSFLYPSHEVKAEVKQIIRHVLRNEQHAVHENSANLTELPPIGEGGSSPGSVN